MHHYRFGGVVSAWVLVLAATAGAEPVGLFEILRHEVDAEGSAQLFDGGPADTFTWAYDLPMQTTVNQGAHDSTGTGAGNSSSSAGFISRMVSPALEPEKFIFRTDASASYIGDGPNRPGGTSSASMASIIEFVMPAERADFALSLRHVPDGFFSQSGSVLVENITANQEIFSANSQLTFQGSYAGNVGDIIRITSDFSAMGSVPADVSGFFGSLTSFVIEITVPEPATGAIVIFGATFCLSARRRGRADLTVIRTCLACEMPHVF